MSIKFCLFGCDIYCIICEIMMMGHFIAEVWEKKTFGKHFISDILYCSDPGCSAIQFTHNSKQQHGCYQRGMDPRVVVNVEHMSVQHSHWFTWGVFGLLANDKCRVWRFQSTEETNEISQMVKYSQGMDPGKTTPESLVLYAVWNILDRLQQSHAML